MLFSGDFTIVEDTTVVDPLYQGRTFVITNQGATLTDLSLNAVDPTTSEPARVFVKPAVNHARLATGQSMRVTVYPVYTAADAAFSAQSSTTPGTISAASGTIGAASGATGATSGPALPAIPFSLTGNGGGNVVSAASSSGCNLKVFPVTVINKVLTCLANDWYCTNRPVINLNLSTPPNISTKNIRAAWIKMLFQPQSNALPHNGQFLLNGTRWAVSATSCLGSCTRSTSQPLRCRPGTAASPGRLTADPGSDHPAPQRRALYFNLTVFAFDADRQSRVFCVRRHPRPGQQAHPAD
ncbi:MAG: hypothetical protein AB9888_00240 [Bacteroidales bacterium]